MARIAVIHFGLKGHLGPATRLGARLLRRGHEVHAWAPPAHRGSIEATGAVLHPHEPVQVSAIGGGGTGFAAGLASATQATVEGLAADLLESQIDFVVHDCQALWGRVAADFLGLPRIVSYPLFPSVAVDSGEEGLPEPHRALVVSHPPGWEQSLERFRAARAAIGRRWGVDIGDWPQAMTSVGPLTLNYSTPEIVGTDAPEGWRFAGPLLDAAPAPRTRNATGEPPLVYVSLGTYFNFVLSVYRAVIDALAELPVTGLISTGGGLVKPRDLGTLPDNVRASEFVPGREVLAGASVFVTHCGINSVHESLAAGVPMVCLPQGHDQFAWAARMRRLGTGVIPAHDTPAAIGEAMLELLSGRDARAAAAGIGRRMLDYDGNAVLSAAVTEVMAGREAA